MKLTESDLSEMQLVNDNLVQLVNEGAVFKTATVNLSSGIDVTMTHNNKSDEFEFEVPS